MPNSKPFTPFAVLALPLLLLVGCASLTANCVSGDCVNGQGTILGFGGWSYAGEFRSGQAQGKGTFTWMNGTRFDGQFEGGRRVGPGALTFTSGKVLRGTWNDVKAVGYQNFAEFSAAPPLRNDPALIGQTELSMAGEGLRIEEQEIRRRPQASSATPSPGQPPLADLPSPRRVALVIGNSAYQQAPLRNPANDARDIAATLKRLGFDVILRTNADLPTMERAVDEFYASLKRGGTGLFYFAGHGMQVGGINYLVPVGARLQSESDVRYQTMDAGKVLGKMEDAGNGLNLVILDACRNNPFARSFRSASQGLAKMDAPTGSLIAYATAPGSVAADGEGRNGVYTTHLLKNLATPKLSVEEMFKRVRLGVVGETQKAQVPWEASSLTGNFSFAD
ncbi:MAG: caspase family protein [Betaproteobacteria bacterium]